MSQRSPTQDLRWLRVARGSLRPLMSTRRRWSCSRWQRQGCRLCRRYQDRHRLSPGDYGLPAAGGEPQSGNYWMVMSEIYRSNAQAITLFAIARV